MAKYSKQPSIQDQAKQNIRYIPRSTPVPNDFLDRLAHYLTPEEQAVLMKAVRQILGFHWNLENRSAWIALSVFTDGVWVVDEETGEKKQVALSCGITSPATVRDCLRELVRFGILKEGGTSVHGKLYTLVIESQAIDWKGLQERYAERKKKNRERTKSASKARRQQIQKANPRRVQKENQRHKSKEKEVQGLRELPALYARKDFAGRREMYINLLRAAGIGPRIANRLLDHLGPDTHQTLIEGKVDILTVIPGIREAGALKYIDAYAHVADRLGEPEPETEKNEQEIALQAHIKEVITTLHRKSDELTLPDGIRPLPRMDKGHIAKEVRRKLHEYSVEDIVNCAAYLTTTQYFRGKTPRPIQPGSISLNIDNWISMGRPVSEEVAGKQKLNQINTTQVHRTVDDPANQNGAACNKEGVPAVRSKDIEALRILQERMAAIQQ